MKIFPMGDYYVWYCDWCDSRNQTLWARIDLGVVTCAACHAAVSLFAAGDGRRSHREGETVSRRIHA